MKTIKDLTEVTSLSASDEFLVSLASGGDRRVKFSAISANTSNNAIFRGKSLGTITASNIDTFISDHGISTGNFTDIYLGDYFTISYAGSNKTIRVAGFNVFKGCGDTSLSKNHIVCVPDGSLCTAAMNSTNTTGISANDANTSGKGAFLGSDMWNITLPTVNTNLEAVFGGHLLTHREILTNSIDANATSCGNSGWKGASNNREWVDCRAVLMSEAEVYGTTVYSSSGYDTGIAKQQLPLFSVEPRFIHQDRTYYWLRDVASSSYFCVCDDHGFAGCHYASFVYHVRPRFLLG
jgi:hypothetical protein